MSPVEARKLAKASNIKILPFNPIVYHLEKLKETEPQSTLLFS